MRYLKLWLSFLKMSWMADMEYRLNISLRIVGEMVWYVTQLSVFEVLYTHTQAISGWDIHAMRVFLGTLFLVDVLYMILFEENMNNLFNLVRKGDLDLYLVKPVNSQFMVSFRKVSTTYFFNFLLLLGYLVWAILQLKTSVGFAQILTFSVLVLCGLITQYSLRFLFSTLSVVLQDAGNIHFVWHQLYRLAMRPDRLYPFYLRTVVMTVLPMAFVASVPARAVIEGVDWTLLGSALGMSGILLGLSSVGWGWALRSYASASS